MPVIGPDGRAIAGSAVIATVAPRRIRWRRILFEPGSAPR
jgi:hypothetical protein